MFDKCPDCGSPRIDDIADSYECGAWWTHAAPVRARLVSRPDECFNRQIASLTDEVERLKGHLRRLGLNHLADPKEPQ